jgi:hypothetical protein
MSRSPFGDQRLPSPACCQVLAVSLRDRSIRHSTFDTSQQLRSEAYSCKELDFRSDDRDRAERPTEIPVATKPDAEAAAAHFIVNMGVGNGIFIVGM